MVVTAWALDRGFDYPSTLSTAGLILSLHAIGSELPPKLSLRWGIVLTAAITAFTAAGTVILESVDYTAIIVTGVATAAPIALGREVNQRRTQVEELEVRAVRAERDREEQARLAVARERTRIARELHDVVAHQMAVMTVQAEGARRLARRSDPRIAEALDVIRNAGHAALTEMRHMVGLLRADDEHSAPDLKPQPGLNRLKELTTLMSEAGLPVEVEIIGPPRQLPPGLDMSAYRIIQESLTNTLKHAGAGATACVAIEYEPELVRLEITDDGIGVPPQPAGYEAGGHGIVGMRERVAVAEGIFRAGPRPGGGFEVVAELPTRS